MYLCDIYPIYIYIYIYIYKYVYLTHAAQMYVVE